MVTTGIRFQAYVSAFHECVDTCKHAYRDCTVAVFDAQAVTIAFYPNKIMTTQKNILSYKAFSPSECLFIHWLSSIDKHYPRFPFT